MTTRSNSNLVQPLAECRSSLQVVLVSLDSMISYESDAKSVNSAIEDLEDEGYEVIDIQSQEHYVMLVGRIKSKGAGR